MKVSDMYGGSFLKADDLQGRTVRVVIDACTLEELGGEGGVQQKWVLSFRGKDKRLVLNKTNALRIAAMHGEDTDEWIGREVRLYSEPVQFQGRLVPAIRVYVEQPEASQGEDEIPF